MSNEDLTDFDFFKPTEDDIKEAANGGRPVFENNEEVIFMINDVSQKEDDEGKKYLIVGTSVLSGDNKGRKHGFFIRNNPTSKGIWISMLGAIFTEDEIKLGINPTSVISKMIKSTCNISVSKGVSYSNFYKFEEVSDVPDVGGTSVIDKTVNADDIPF